MLKDREARNKYSREWVASRKRAWLSDKSCVRCGSVDNLELDHIDRSTKVTHRIWSWSIERREKELRKCQVLCKDHHREKTISEFRGPDHGISERYKQGCRCRPCKDVQAKRIRIYRAKIKQK